MASLQRLTDSAALRRWGPGCCLAAAAGLFLLAYWRHPERPHIGRLGWWGFWDQGRYLEATQALARLDLSAAKQSYEPGYAVIAAPFTAVYPADPFLVPNLLALLLACWLFGLISERLLGPSGWSRPLGMALFVATTVGDPRTAATWVMPWTTTPVVPLLLAAPLAAAAVVERLRPWACCAAAFCCCAILAFRPGDAVIAALPCSIAVLIALVRHRRDRRGVALTVAGGAAGAAAALLPAMLAHWAVWGVAASPYMQLSNSIGFDLGLLPLRWVLIVVGPEPMTAGRGLAAAFPWVVSGVAGALTCLVLPRRTGRALHVVLIATAAGTLTLFLSYRDLHPAGLWRFQTLHYFKWLIPLAALYSFILIRRLWLGPRRTVLALTALAAAVGLFNWRPVLRPVSAGAPALVKARQDLTLPDGLPRLDDAILVAAETDWASIYETSFAGWAGNRQYVLNSDFKAYPRPGGFLLVPLRAINGPITFHFSTGVRLDPDVAPITVRQQMLFQPPCWLAGCDAERQFPPFPWPLQMPIRTLGTPVPFGPSIDPWLTSGWTAIGLDGERGTIGGRSGLLLRLLPVPADGATLVVQATAFVPEGSDPLDVRVSAGAKVVATWHVTDADPHGFVVPLPQDAFEPDGTVRLSFAVANPRRPSAWLPGSTDQRLLGLRVRSVTFQPAGGR